jgi:high-affinity K+ transport system ATPase subunit B
LRPSSSDWRAEDITKVILDQVNFATAPHVLHLRRCPDGALPGRANRRNHHHRTTTRNPYRTATAKISRGGMNSVMLLSFIPMLLTGCFLGLLAVVGQGSKTGFMQVVTAIVLLADVLFKVGATLLTEGHEYLMHKRVTRLMAERNNAQERKKEHFEARF